MDAAPAPGDYGRAFADVYDDWYPTDVRASQAADCIAALASGGPVLELGVGTGRVALPLVDRGVDVWGIDASAEMLDVLGRKDRDGRVTAALGDMAELLLPPGAPPFSVVFAAFNTFYLLTSEEAQRVCLDRCRTVLARGGRLVLELYSPAPAGPGHRQWREESVVADGTDVVSEYARSDADGRLLLGHTSAAGGDGSSRPWALRPLPVDVLDAMVAGAGFELEARWRNWGGDRYFGHYGEHVSVWRVATRFVH